jgi:hypothetical protein
MDQRSGFFMYGKEWPIRNAGEIQAHNLFAHMNMCSVYISCIVIYPPVNHYIQMYMHLRAQLTFK